ncbi:MAG TPA: alanyl-tRNA editing protein [Synergistales bacterium]|nr:alanyl-tRNA editing protein [Synergistales bacterium]
MRFTFYRYERKEEYEKMLLNTRLKRVIHKKGREYHIWLEDNPFHPEGGGQPGDSGEIRADKFRGTVTGCQKDGNAKFLEVQAREGNPQTGMVVELFLDETRNHNLSRSHTAQHIFSRILEDRFPGLMTTKVNIHDQASTVYLCFDGDLRLEDIFDAEEEVNAVIRRGLEVKVESYDFDTAKMIEGLKAKWDLLSPDESVKVVRVGDMDINACAGTHVKSTDQIGGFLVLALKGRKPYWEVRYSLEKESICMEHSRVLRKFSYETDLVEKEILKNFRNLKNENQNLSRTIKALLPLINIPWNTSSCGGYTIYYTNPENIPLEIVTQISRKKIDEESHSLVLVIISRHEGDNFNFVLRKGEKVPIDLQSLVGSIPDLKARGGGKGGFMSGMTDEGSVSRWVSLICSQLDKGLADQVL